MSSIITGLGSGFDINTWVNSLVSAKKSSSLTPLQNKLATLKNKNSALSTLKTKFSTLQSSLQTFTNTIYDSSSDMWTNTKITSSGDAYATATSTGNVASGKVDLRIQQIATATKAQSVKGLGIISETNAKDVKFENLSNGSAKTGKFSIFLEGSEYEINIKDNYSLRDVMNEIETVTDGKVKASIDNDGKFNLTAYEKIENEDGTFAYEKLNKPNFTIGSSNDESNFAKVLKLQEQNDEGGYTSAYAISTVNSKAKISTLDNLKFFDSENSYGKGTITINGIDFEINEDMSINDIVSKINSNSDVKVKASYDSLTNKFVLTSTETGAGNISLKEKGTNFLNVVGLTEGTGESEKLAKDSQKLGQNAIVYINDKRVVSASNTITGETSGIQNLSITVKKPTSEFSGNNDDEKNITLDIEPDYTKVKEALKTFVNAYNDAVKTTKSYTSSDGAIGSDSSLRSILTNLRSLTSKVSDNTGSLKMLAEIGISATKSDASTLTIDEKKLDEVLSKDFESVKVLLSDGYVKKGDTGVLDSLLQNVNNALDIQNGYFTNAQNSIESQIKSQNNRIDTVTKRIERYEARITKQFNAMDSAISALTSQLSTFQSYFG